MWFLYLFNNWCSFLRFEIKCHRLHVNLVKYEHFWKTFVAKRLTHVALVKVLNTTCCILFRDWILLVCFSWRYEATEGPRVNFVMREALFEIYTWILCRFIPPLDRVPTVLEMSLNFWFSLKSPWRWICPWKVLEFREPSLKFQLVVLDFLFCVFWAESLNRYGKLRGTRANFPKKKIWLASLAAAYKLNIFPVPLAHI